MSDGTHLLEVRGLSKRFGGLQAVDNVDFHAEAGEIVGVIGPNGAGKTTLFNIVTGFYERDEGTIRFDGHSLVGLKPNQIAKLGIARTFQAVRLFHSMTVLENAMVGRHVRTRSGVLGAVLRPPWTRQEERAIEARAREVLAFFGDRLVGQRLDQLAAELAYADRRRLEIARAMATDPKMLLLDEPAAGMNPAEKVGLIELIGRLRDEKGYAIVLIEHDMAVVKGISDRVVALDYGRKIAEGTYDEVSSDERVIEAYLGKQGTREAG
ncbi:MAG: ABC transporter ATP-binding protein [Actinobacteria bacterium]|nr:ABC transporter ATP-binding protein [Actinomycetota bacterium]